MLISHVTIENTYLIIAFSPLMRPVFCTLQEAGHLFFEF